MAQCKYCRRVLAEVVKQGRENELQPPGPLLWKAESIGVGRRRFRVWMWAPAGAAALAALVAALTLLPQKPKLPEIQSPSVATPTLGSANTPAVVAKAKVTSAPMRRARQILRGATTAPSGPAVVLPKENSVVRTRPLRIVWRSVATSRNYEVRVTKADGDPLWQTQTTDCEAQVPSAVVLDPGSYFVWVSAGLEDGRTQRSAPVRFVVER